jgi:hypothetical protein
LLRAATRETELHGTELLSHLGSYELGAEPGRHTSNWARAWRRLPIEFPAF